MVGRLEFVFEKEDKERIRKALTSCPKCGSKEIHIGTEPKRDPCDPSKIWIMAQCNNCAASWWQGFFYTTYELETCLDGYKVG